jgi:excisionase family DNA binding protein
MFTVEEIAAILRVSPKVVRGLIHRGELKAVRVGKQYRISKTVLDAYLGV